MQSRPPLAPEAFLDRIRDIGYDLHALQRHGGQRPTAQDNAAIMQDSHEYQSDHIDLVAYPRPHSIG